MDRVPALKCYHVLRKEGITRQEKEEIHANLVLIFILYLVMWQSLPQLFRSFARINPGWERDPCEFASQVKVPTLHGDHSHSRMLKSGESIRLLAFVGLIRPPPVDARGGASTLVVHNSMPAFFNPEMQEKHLKSQHAHSPGFNFHHSKRLALKGQSHFLSRR
jgi:hypothetical protein